MAEESKDDSNEPIIIETVNNFAKLTVVENNLVPVGGDVPNEDEEEEEEETGRVSIFDKVHGRAREITSLAAAQVVIVPVDPE